MHHCSAKRYILGLGPYQTQNTFAESGSVVQSLRGNVRYKQKPATALGGACLGIPRRTAAGVLPTSHPQSFPLYASSVLSRRHFGPLGPPGAGKIRKIWWAMTDDSRKTVA